ncbi:UDP-glucuronosyltransferase 2B20-like isoform X2 [Octopus sinensis]|nr:UDP-glucuronosyltransferase 2B20-like isoform X2 [Octopus sinensis]XP_036362977.1 UDP-glucuronosyltransferase 2B20-like isoform X2 [Octopus sinensis]XP_036362978.1 UDP-glucuronosyltransferase 2B20-like isoform X2 [Octopus sinensis]XP_036362979.1 UDP-glucuronosyltransferase 2B20-like isoform X2 [Octopus sinensis]
MNTMRTFKLSFFYLSLLSINQQSKADNILFLSMPWFSHVQGQIHTAMKLKAYGHTSYFSLPPKLITAFKNKDGIKFIPIKEDQNVSRFIELTMKYFSVKKEGSWFQIKHLIQNMCDNFLLDNDWYHSIKELNASFAIVDSIFFSQCLAIVPYRLSIPFLFQGLLFGEPFLRRVPWNPAVFPLLSSPHSDKMTFFQKLKNTLLTYSLYTFSPWAPPSKSVKEYAPEKNDIPFESVLRKAQLFLTESDLLLSYPKPSLPSEVFIGGIATHPALPLQGDIKEFVERSKHGIIIVSFGGYIRELPKEHIEKMEKAFKEIKYDVIWKQPDSKQLASNILIKQWLPQNDLLGHPKTKLFITHCGINGLFEALYHGVPILGLPVFADQFQNGLQMHVKEYGISMDIYNYNKDELVSNINELIENSKYKTNIKLASEIFHSRPEHPAERAARYVDHVIKYGGDYLRSPSQNMPLYQFLMLDIYATFLAIIIAVVLVVKFVVSKCYRCCFAKKEKTE